MAYDLPDKPSIAILPFDYIAGDETDRYLADGFVESLITELARIPDLFVIARNSSFVFRDQDIGLREISQQLGVRYIVKGSLQRTNENLRIHAQLIDAVAGNYIWSKRYDRPSSEFFLVQDEVIDELTLEIGGRGSGGIYRAERDRLELISNDELSAIELWEKASQAFFKHNRESNELNGQIAREMIAKFPNHSRGYAALGYYHIGRLLHAYSDNAGADLSACVQAGEKAVQLDSQDYMAHLQLGYCYVFLNQPDISIPRFRQAYELNPNDVIVRREYAKHVLIPEGELGEAIALLKSLLRLSPGQQVGVNSDIGVIYFVKGDYEKAVEYGQREAVAGFHYKGRLAASLWMNGQHEEAQRLVHDIMETAPASTADNYAGFAAHATPEAKQRGIEALKAAGMPE